jgi:plasmid stabilization system protein ParE
MNLEIIPQAQRDIAEAAQYYRDRRAGLDVDFLEEIDAAVASIAREPLRFEQVRPGIRRCFLERFP